MVGLLAGMVASWIKMSLILNLASVEVEVEVKTELGNIYDVFLLCLFLTSFSKL